MRSGGGLRISGEGRRAAGGRMRPVQKGPRLVLPTWDPRPNQGAGGGADRAEIGENPETSPSSVKGPRMEVMPERALRAGLQAAWSW